MNHQEIDKNIVMNIKSDKNRTYYVLICIIHLEV